MGHAATDQIALELAHLFGISTDNLIDIEFHFNVENLPVIKAQYECVVDRENVEPVTKMLQRVFKEYEIVIKEKKS